MKLSLDPRKILETPGVYNAFQRLTRTREYRRRFMEGVPLPAGARVLAAGLVLHAGHGLTYRNVKPIAAISGITELNIGHSIVARAIMVGFEQAVREMKGLVGK